MKAIEFLENRIDWVRVEIDEAFERREQVQRSIDRGLADLLELEDELSRIKEALNVQE